MIGLPRRRRGGLRLRGDAARRRGRARRPRARRTTAATPVGSVTSAWRQDGDETLLGTVHVSWRRRPAARRVDPPTSRPGSAAEFRMRPDRRPAPAGGRGIGTLRWRTVRASRSAARGTATRHRPRLRVARRQPAMAAAATSVLPAASAFVRRPAARELGRRPRASSSGRRPRSCDVATDRNRAAPRPFAIHAGSTSPGGAGSHRRRSRPRRGAVGRRRDPSLTASGTGCRPTPAPGPPALQHGGPAGSQVDRRAGRPVIILGRAPDRVRLLRAALPAPTSRPRARRATRGRRGSPTPLEVTPRQGGARRPSGSGSHTVGDAARAPAARPPGARARSTELVAGRDRDGGRRGALDHQPRRCAGAGCARSSRRWWPTRPAR